MYYSDSSTVCCLQKKAPKIVDTIKINGKYFDVSMVKEKALIVSSSAIVSILMIIGAVILF